MRELRVIVGTTYELKGERHEVKAKPFKEFEAAVVHEYGRYTKTIGRGVWIDIKGRLSNETCIIYDVAANSEQPLRKLAATLCTRANQHCVYFRDWNGDVSFVRGPEAR